MYTPAPKYPRKRKAARRVGELMGKIMAPVLARRSGMTMDLLNAWPQLAGDEYCDYTRPVKINWPNRAHENEPFKPGILIVACDGARAIYFQHDLSRICARVNVFFGFTAIAKIKIVQKPVNPLSTKTVSQEPKLSEEKSSHLKSILEDIDDPKLRAHLQALGQGVMGKKSVSDD